MGNERSNLKRYGGLSQAAAEEDAKQKSAEDALAGGAFLKLPDGDSFVRFLPTKIEWNRSTPFVRVYQHYVDVPGVDKRIVFNCPRIMGKRSCLVCKQVEKYRATGNPADREQSYQMRAKFRGFANVIDRVNPEGGPQVLAFSQTVYDSLIALADPKKGGDYTNPEEDGFDIIFNRTGVSLDTKWTVHAARESSPLAVTVEQIEAWIADQADPMVYAGLLSDDQIAKKLSGLFESESRALTPSARREARPPTVEDDALKEDT